MYRNYRTDTVEVTDVSELQNINCISDMYRNYNTYTVEVIAVSKLQKTL